MDKAENRELRSLREDPSNDNVYQCAYEDLEKFPHPSSRHNDSNDSGSRTQKFESGSPSMSKQECGSGFPSPGRFSNTMEDLFEESSLLKQDLDSFRREERIESAIMNLASHGDLNCDGQLSKTELEHFRSIQSLPSAVKDLTQHMLDNFEAFASFSKNKLEEIKDPHARKIAESILPLDMSSDDFVSAADLKALKSLSPMALPFLMIQASEQSQRKLAGLSEAEQKQAIEELSAFLDSKLQERKRLFTWK